MAIDYALAKSEHSKLKAALTRAQKKGYNAVLATCRTAVARWDVWGAWPDNWSNWQRALDDAALKQNRENRYAAQVIAPRLGEL